MTDNAALLVSLILQSLFRLQEYAQVLKKAREEGRDVTQDELNALALTDDQLKSAVDAEVARRGG